MDLRLNPEQFEQLVSAVIMQQLTPEQREEILKNAITHLLTKNEGYARGRVSPLQEAFNAAIGNVAHRFAREWLEAQPDVQQQITGLVAEAYQQALSGDRAAMVDRIAVQMSKAFERDY